MDRLSDYDYHLPDGLIAQKPLVNRDHSRLLVLDRQTGAVSHRIFHEIESFLRPGDLLVLNNTRVTAIRLFGQRPSGAKVEILLLKEIDDGHFEAMVRPSKRIKPGTAVSIDGGITLTIGERLNDVVRSVTVEPVPNWRHVLARVGHVPLPPYITEHLADASRYQTVFAQSPGSAAAPTAGLHFTDDLLKRLTRAGVGIAHVTLDVSLDTFRPVTAENLDDHVMHGEMCRIDSDTADKVNCCRGRVIAVGTTTVRTLETFAEGSGRVRSGEANSKLFIRPGFEFQVVQGLVTNFHMPRTTMLVMLAAFCSRPYVEAAYEAAVRENYRFLSFGDSMLII